MADGDGGGGLPIPTPPPIVPIPSPGDLKELLKVKEALVAIGKAVENFSNNPRKWVVSIILNVIVNPLFSSAFRAGAFFVGVVGFVFFGSDCALGLTGGGCRVGLLAGTGLFGQGSFLGLADVPIYVANALFRAFTPLGNAVVSPIQQINNQIGGALVRAGLPGPIGIAVIQVAEIAAGLYALSLLLESVASLVGLGPVAERITSLLYAPIRRVLP